MAQIVPGAELTGLQVRGANDSNRPLELEYTFDVPAIGRVQGDYWMVPQLFGVRLSRSFATTASRTTAQVIGTIPVQFIQALPYVLTVLLLAGFVGKAVAPKAIGIP